MRCARAADLSCYIVHKYVLRDLLRKCVNCALRMSGGQKGETAGIDDAQTFNAVHTRPGIDHGHCIVRTSHLTCRRGVPDGRHGRLNVLEDGGVRGDVKPRLSLLPLGETEVDGDVPGLAGPLEHLDDHLLITRIGQPSRVDEGQVAHTG